MKIEKERQEKLTVIYARCSTLKQKEKGVLHFKTINKNT